VKKILQKVGSRNQPTVPVGTASRSFFKKKTAKLKRGEGKTESQGENSWFGGSLGEEEP